MPTPSETHSTGQWAPRTDTPKRSIFGNYRSSEAGAPASPATHVAIGRQSEAAGKTDESQVALETAMARAFVYRFLAKAYEDPTLETWEWLCASETLKSLASAWRLVTPDQALALTFQPGNFSEFHNTYLAAFGHAARGSCPLNEIEYGDIKADPLFQPHRLADLAAFYRAFGLEVAEDAGERHDHLCLELEFMCVLAAKTAYALDHQLPEAQLQVSLDAQKKFLREHLGRWTPAFTRRLAAATSEPVLQNLANFTRTFVEAECARFGIAPGSHELALRPVDEAADRMCESCGINQLPPGALAST